MMMILKKKKEEERRRRRRRRRRWCEYSPRRRAWWIPWRVPWYARNARRTRALSRQPASHAGNICVLWQSAVQHALERAQELGDGSGTCTRSRRRCNVFSRAQQGCVIVACHALLCLFFVHFGFAVCAHGVAGYGFVVFQTEEEADKCVSVLNGYEMEGRTISVHINRPVGQRDSAAAEEVVGGDDLELVNGAQ